MDAATELAQRFGATGEVDSLGFVHGPADVGVHRMWLALEADEPDQAVSVAQQVHPERHPFPVNRSNYWVHYGRALARVRRRQDDAVVALRTAEDIFPTRVHRDPMVRDVIAGLLARSRRDSPMDRQPRGRFVCDHPGRGGRDCPVRAARGVAGMSAPLPGGAVHLLATDPTDSDDACPGCGATTGVQRTTSAASASTRKQEQSSPDVHDARRT